MRPSARHLALLLALIAPGAAHGVVRRMFITSVTGNARLGDWPDAGAATGVDAGDAICVARAAAGGLANPAGFRAWLSSSTTDAYCHIHGLTGQIATNCGQPSLPAAAGPWRRSDGLPFGADIVHLLSPDQEVLLPPNQDEFGVEVHDASWTATFPDGSYFAPSCNNWTSAIAAQSPMVGNSESTAVGWASGGSAGSCADLVHLLCLESGVGDPLPRFANWGRLAFLTSAAGSGNLHSWAQAGGQNGLAAGDAICRNLATTASLPNPTSFKAWLSTNTVDARDRFAHDGPWMRLDRARIAADLADLTDGFLHTALNLTETGIYMANFNVWTGTDASGLAVVDRCSEWTSGSAGVDGGSGVANFAGLAWTFSLPTGCDLLASHLYCLQDLPLIFGDGFESAGTAVWSVVVP